jgi:hypothetical protein
MNKLIKIYDDLFTEQETNEYEKLITEWNFPWHLREQTCAGNEKDFGFMIHSFYSPETEASAWCSIAVQILQKFVAKTNTNYQQMIRANANLVHKTNYQNHSIIHTDNPNPHHVLLYYVNNSDGDTVILENQNIVKKISPKKGRFFLFDGSINHAIFPCVNNDKRIVINYNLEIPK